MLHSKNLDFSFSGLKTAVLTLVKNHQTNLCEQDKANIARAFVDAIVEVLVRKSMAALAQTGWQRLVVAGGVGANAELRRQLSLYCQSQGASLHFPELNWCTDNGAMIALAAAMRLQSSVESAVLPGAFDVKPRWPLMARE